MKNALFRRIRSIFFAKKIRRATSKSSRAVKLLKLFTVLAVISGFMALGAHFLSKDWDSTVFREYMEVQARDTVSINSADIMLKVFPHDGDKIIINYIGETKLIIEDDELEVKIRREEDFTFSLFTPDKLNYKMLVYLPRIMYRELKLYSAAGDIFAQDIETGLLNINSRTGNVDLSGIEGLIIVNTRQGKVRAEFSNLTDGCSIDTDTGSVEILMPERYNIKLDFLTDMGKFTSNFFRREYEGYQGDLYLSSGEDNTKFTVRTISGNLDFYKKIEYIN